MKKFALFITLAVLTVIGFGFSSVNAKAVPTTATTTPTIYTGISSGSQYGFETFTYGLWAGKTVSAGSVTVANDTQNLYVTVTSPAFLSEVHIYLYSSLANLPTSRPVPGLAPYVAKNINAHQVTLAIPVTTITAGQTYYLAVHVSLTASETETDPAILALAGETAYAAGNATPTFTGKGAWYYVIGYTVTPVIIVDDPLTTETAWAFGGANAIPFGSTRWGWSNGPLSQGTYLFDLYAAAGQNNLNAGTLVGTLSVVYANQTVTVTYSTSNGFTLNDVHLYVGSTFLPMGRNGNYTYAPGQFPYIAESVKTNTYTFTLNNVSGSVYIAAHAVVEGRFGN